MGLDSLKAEIADIGMKEKDSVLEQVRLAGSNMQLAYEKLMLERNSINAELTERLERIGKLKAAVEVEAKALEELHRRNDALDETENAFRSDLESGGAG